MVRASADAAHAGAAARTAQRAAGNRPTVAQTPPGPQGRVASANEGRRTSRRELNALPVVEFTGARFAGCRPRVVCDIAAYEPRAFGLHQRAADVARGRLKLDYRTRRGGRGREDGHHHRQCGKSHHSHGVQARRSVNMVQSVPLLHDREALRPGLGAVRIRICASGVTQDSYTSTPDPPELLVPSASSSRCRQVPDSRSTRFGQNGCRRCCRPDLTTCTAASVGPPVPRSL